MKRFLFIFIAVAAVLASCNNYETYGDKKEKERNAIEKFISDRSITIISEDQFKSQGMKTNVDRNEYVKLNKSEGWRNHQPHLPLFRVQHPSGHHAGP